MTVGGRSLAEVIEYVTHPQQHHTKVALVRIYEEVDSGSGSQSS